MAMQLDNEDRATVHFEQNLPLFYRSFLKKFKKVSRSFVNFNILFLAVATLEIVLFLTFFSFLAQSAILAYSLSAFFLTGFSYFVLLFYFQAQKPEQFALEIKRLIQSCKNLLPAHTTGAEGPLSVAQTLCNLSSYLQDFESNFYKLPSFLEFLSPMVSRFSASFYWKDVFAMKEMLLLSAVKEHLEQIKITPTDLEVHASLANTYICLSKLYCEPITTDSVLSQRELRKQSPFQKQAKLYSQLAIEEFKILNHYAANDPWIHEQMALGFKNLNIPQEEIKEMEILLKLRPHDKEILFQLGTLYFKQGFNAKGLQVYEDLKRTHAKKAIELIALYGHTLSIQNELYRE